MSLLHLPIAALNIFYDTALASRPLSHTRNVSSGPSGVISKIIWTSGRIFSVLSQLWLQRSRLSSVRTLPERLEFRGSGREAELREEASRSGGLHRARFGSERGNPCISIGRHRKLSTASSPSSYKVWTAEQEEEVDSYGYVLAGSPVTPERGKWLGWWGERILTNDDLLFLKIIGKL